MATSRCPCASTSLFTLPSFSPCQAAGQQAAARPGYGAPAGSAAGGYGGRPGGPSQPGGYGASPSSRPGQPGGYGGSGPAAGGGRYGQTTVSAPYREQQQRPSSMPGFTPAGQVRLSLLLKWLTTLLCTARYDVEVQCHSYLLLPLC